jgi:SRSO17 transposase
VISRVLGTMLGVSVDVEGWAEALVDLHERVCGRFGRSEPRQRALAYLRGLLAGLERKNGWTLAEQAGESGPDGMQRLLRTTVWDVDGLRDDLRDYVVEHLGDPGAVLSVDETGFLKKGTKSAGVQRQYSGTAGRTENCQVGTFLAYASRHGRALIDRELYMPASWLADGARCVEAEVPGGLEFATKPEQAKKMIARAIAAGVPFRWVTGDEVYGHAKHLQTWLSARDVFYVLAVKVDDTVTTADGTDTAVKELIAALPPRAWYRRSAAKGAHGERIYDWARIPLPAPANRPGSSRGRWVLARRRISDGEISYYVCFGPAVTTLQELLTVAATRWTIEMCFQAAKNEAGLDHYQVRHYQGWYRHITLSMLAHAFLAVTAAQATRTTQTADPGEKGTHPLWTTAGR